MHFPLGSGQIREPVMSGQAAIIDRTVGLIVLQFVKKDKSSQLQCNDHVSVNNPIVLQLPVDII